MSRQNKHTIFPFSSPPDFVQVIYLPKERRDMKPKGFLDFIIPQVDLYYAAYWHSNGTYGDSAVLLAVRVRAKVPSISAWRTLMYARTRRQTYQGGIRLNRFRAAAYNPFHIENPFNFEGLG